MCFGDLRLIFESVMVIIEKKDVRKLLLSEIFYQNSNFVCQISVPKDRFAKTYFQKNWQNQICRFF